MTRIAARCERRLGDALQARAATPSGLSRFASSCQHRIAIAAEDRLFVFYLGGCAGAIVTVLAAFCWSLVL